MKYRDDDVRGLIEAAALASGVLRGAALDQPKGSEKRAKLELTSRKLVEASCRTMQVTEQQFAMIMDAIDRLVGGG